MSNVMVDVNGIKVSRLSYISSFNERKKTNTKLKSLGSYDEALQYIADKSFDYDTYNSTLSNQQGEDYQVREFKKERGE